MIPLIVIGVLITALYVGILVYGARYYDRVLIEAGNASYNVSQALAKALAEMTDLKDEVETYKKLAESEKLNHELCHRSPVTHCGLKPTTIKPGFVKKGGVNTPPKNPRPRTPTPKKRPQNG